MFEHFLSIAKRAPELAEVAPRYPGAPWTVAPEAIRRLQLSVLIFSRQEKTRHHIQDSEISLLLTLQLYEARIQDLVHVLQSAPVSGPHTRVASYCPIKIRSGPVWILLFLVPVELPSYWLYGRNVTDLPRHMDTLSTWRSRVQDSFRRILFSPRFFRLVPVPGSIPGTGILPPIQYSREWGCNWSTIDSRSKLPEEI
jgi:hypothetical protein